MINGLFHFIEHFKAESSIAVVESGESSFSEKLNFFDLGTQLLRKSETSVFFEFAFKGIREHEIIFNDLFGFFPIASSQCECIGIMNMFCTIERSHFKQSIINDKYN